ncbi:unnamed protein product [Brugia pahangi]|uniref:EGF-like domain-containing protein n=1 Tax=Brugia pahangi TaxID=6280 RepID=A0A0N4TL77_BRUPA|nr:unnamed protein product [Brugia pahangi]
MEILRVRELRNRVWTGRDRNLEMNKKEKMERSGMDKTKIRQIKRENWLKSKYFSGFNGTLCEYRQPSRCDEAPCVHGRCILSKSLDTFRCECQIGFTVAYICAEMYLTGNDLN